MERNCNNCRHQVRRDGYVGCEKWECNYEFGCGKGKKPNRTIGRNGEKDTKQREDKKT